jgi:DNA-binding NarL/FixJ family response regulator
MAQDAAKILIVDDHPLVNHGLAQIIEEEESLTVCGQAATAAEASQLFASTHPDLVVLDIMLPDGDGFELLTDFTAGDGSVKVLVFSSLDPELYANKARSLGAAGYVHKSMVIGEIIPAIHAALEEKRP